MMRCAGLASAFLMVLAAVGASAYPLDGEDESGIRRLQGMRIAQDTPGAPKLVPGQLLSVDDIRLTMLGYDGPDFDALPQDPALSAFLEQALRRRDPSYAMVLVDLSDPQAIRWAGLRPDIRQNAGSVGKLLCMAGLFHALAEAFPDHEERARVLRESVSSAGNWVSNEIHKVPKWNDALKRNTYSVIVPSDSFRLSEWIDHAMSASANGAASIIWREAMLIRHFGSEYPKSAEESTRFFAETPKRELTALAQAVITEALINADIDTSNLQQGSFWTTNSKAKVPGAISFATPRELARLMLRIEQGRVVDEWSSLQMKKYMYLTKRRYRYAYAPELSKDAVYFKSGSLYSCKPEEGFRCEKYMGNVRNMMNSVAMVQSIAPRPPAQTAVATPAATTQATGADIAPVPMQAVGTDVAPAPPRHPAAGSAPVPPVHSAINAAAMPPDGPGVTVPGAAAGHDSDAQTTEPTRPEINYITVVMSNVLRFNSAWDHSRIAAAVHETMRTQKPQALRETASAEEISEAGKSE